jgi:lipoate-protein ligase B
LSSSSPIAGETPRTTAPAKWWPIRFSTWKIAAATCTAGFVASKKLCAIGIKVKRWVNLHGLALNVHTDMTHFEGIIPCGIQGYGVTSLHELLDPAPSMEQVKAALVRGFEALSS